MTYQVLDLFSGAGGMSEGFIQAGFSIPYASDKSEQAALTYVNRHNQLGKEVKFYCGDVAKLAEKKELEKFLGNDLNKIDVICGGPPCQGFSIAGKRNPDDLRNKLVHSYIKILSQVKPKYFVMENVIGILSAYFIEYDGIKRKYRNTKVVNVLLDEFKNIGYDVEYKILDASDYGVPQKRLRVIFLGRRKDLSVSVVHPVPFNSLKISSKEAIDDLKEINIGSIQNNYMQEAYSEFAKESRNGRTLDIYGNPVSSVTLHNHETSRHSELVIKRFNLVKPGENIRMMFHRLNITEGELLTKKQSCRRIKKDSPSPTVMTLPDDLIHYEKDRILTVREMARLQSFDDSFEFLGKRTTGGDRRKFETPQYTLVGNAVPPLLAKAVAIEIMKSLRKLDSF